jgi:hypothetical protein
MITDQAAAISRVTRNHEIKLKAHEIYNSKAHPEGMEMLD